MRENDQDQSEQPESPPGSEVSDDVAKKPGDSSGTEAAVEATSSAVIVKDDGKSGRGL